MAEYLSARILGDLYLIIFLVFPLLELAALCVLTLDNLPPQRRRGLLALFSALLAMAAALFGGALLLGRNGLAWRTWFQEGLSLLLWLTGLATGLVTVVCAGRWLSRHKGLVIGFSAFCLASAMFTGTVLGGLWALGPSEQVVTYNGRRMILGKWVWMDTSYELYEYHGPLVRGAEPAMADWDWSLVEGAVIEAG